MGVKSTVSITRESAERRWVDMKLESKRPKFEAKAKELSDTELENALEEMNDARYGGEGFDNYAIDDANTLRP